MESLSPDALAAMTGQYAQTITLLSARLGNAAANLVMLGEKIEKLQARIAELEKKEPDAPKA